MPDRLELAEKHFLQAAGTDACSQSFGLLKTLTAGPIPLASTWKSTAERQHTVQAPITGGQPVCRSKFHPEKIFTSRIHAAAGRSGTGLAVHIPQRQ